MNELALIFCAAAYADAIVASTALPPTPPKVLAKIDEFEDVMLDLEQTEIPTDHLFHAGMYTRTVRMPKGVGLTGALMKRATVVIVAGHVRILAGDTWVELAGYNVLPASAGRKQMFVSISEVSITMVFPTLAKTVEEAEAEFTDDAARLLSRWQDANTVIVTED